jgi:membrane protease YdiL (CAAX protease family)
MSKDSSSGNAAVVNKSWLWRKTHTDGKNLGPPTWVTSVTLLILAAGWIVVGVAFSVIYYIIHPNAGASAIENSAAAQLIFIFLTEGMAVAFVLYILRRRKLTLAAIGLGRWPAFSDLWRALGGFVVFYIVFILALTVASMFIPSLSDEKQDVGFDHLQTTTDSILAFIALVILPPLGEETLFRGYLYSGLRFFWRFLPALIVTSLVFGAAHLQLGSGTALLWAAALDTFILSIILVYLREKTGALYACILVHMLNNLIAFGVHFHA